MKRSTYERLLKHLLLPFNCQPYLDALERIHGYLNGEDIIDISYDLDFPPCIVMRRLLESLPIALHRQLLSKAVNNTKQPPQSPKATTPAVAETPTPGTTPLPSMAHTTREPSPTTPITPASEPGDASEGPSEEPPPLSPREAFVQSIPTLPLEDQDTAQLLLRLHDDACRCVEADTMYAPRADAARHDAGVLYEAKLANRLQELGLDFLSEEMLRAKGFFKTPDVKLLVPVAIHGRLVHWIDSKASFGDDTLHSTQYADQYSKYINRFGPGAVVYWFDFLEDLEPQDDLLLLRDIPDNVTTLPQLPLSLVNVPLTAVDSALQEPAGTLAQPAVN